jgi:hypothetical protein
MAETASIFIKMGKELDTVTISNSRLASNGCETFYFPVNRLKGLKVFSSGDNARNSYQRQKKAAEHGLAPKVKSDGVFEVIFPMGFDKLWGTRGKFRDKISWNFKGKVGYGYFTQRAVMSRSSNRRIENKELDELQKKLYKLFPKENPSDTHYGNLGYINGKLVMVDFGDASHK